MMTIIESEVEKLNKKGEYIKTLVQKKYFMGIRYKMIEKTFMNKVTQEVIDAVVKEEKVEDNSKKIGFK